MSYLFTLFLHPTDTSGLVRDQMKPENQKLFPVLNGERVVQAAAAAAVMVGFMVLMGWVFQIEALKSMLPGLVSMKVNTAMAFMFLGLALAIRSTRILTQRLNQISLVSATAVVVIACATMIEYGYGVNLGIDEALIKDTPGAVGTLSPGRMSPISAISFFLLGVATLALRLPHTCARWLIQTCAFIPLVISSRACVGYVYGVPTLYQLGQSSSMALHTTVIFVLLSAGVLYSRPDFELMATIRSGQIGGKLARRLVPAVLVLPLLFGIVFLQGQRVGAFPGNIGLTLYTVATSLILTAIVWSAAHSINHLDERRYQAECTEHELRKLSETESLTGLLNRRTFLEKLEHTCRRVNQSGGTLACMLLDIDCFKKINDMYGHSAGDSALCHVARLLTDVCGPSDVICRYGGEEFCILLPDKNEMDAAVLAEAIRAKLAANRIPLSGTMLQITSSLGVAEWMGHLAKPQELIDFADEALLFAKQTGRNRVVRFSSLNTANPTNASTYLSPLVGLSAGDVMVPMCVRVTINDTLQQVAQYLCELRMDSIPVTDEGGKLAGVISDLDVMSIMITHDTSDQSIGQFVKQTHAWYEHMVAAEEVARYLCRVSVARVVVVRDGEPVGVITRNHLLRWLHHAGSVQHGMLSMAGQERDEVIQLDPTLEALAETARRLTVANQRSQSALNSCVVAEVARAQTLLENLLSLCNALDGQPDRHSATATGAASFV